MKVALVVVYLDLQKAFDTVDHKILLYKLEHYESRGIYNDWFKSYLSDWKQSVSINGYNSDLMPVYCAVSARFCPRTSSFLNL